MGIEASYLRSAPDDLSRLLSDPEWARSFLGQQLDDMDANVRRLMELYTDRRFFSLGKEWHAIHYLLTGEPALGDGYTAVAPLQKVVYGGTPTVYEATYGYVR